MKIKSIKIKGWRSFNDTDGIELNNLKRINLFIGPNNAGKSNLMKFFHTIRRLCEYQMDNGYEPEGLLSCRPNSDLLNGEFLAKNDFWNKTSQKFEAEVVLEGMEDNEIYYGTPLNYRSTFGSYVGFNVQCYKVTPIQNSEENPYVISITPLIPISYDGILQVLQHLKVMAELQPRGFSEETGSQFGYGSDEFERAFALLSKKNSRPISSFYTFDET